MDISYFDYELPDGYVAYHPTRQRDGSKLMVLDRSSGGLTHLKFSQIVDYLNPGDGLVINNTRVFRARLFARRASGGKVELFLLERIKYDGRNCWEVLTHPSRRVKENEWLFFDEKSKVEIIKKLPTGRTVIRFPTIKEGERIIEKFGHVPLPIYIHRPDEKRDEARYQTVYAHLKKAHAVAAPTAGLHFTERILEKIRARGVKIIPVTLHVGYGTFKKVRVQEIEEHTVDPEYAEISKSAANAINRIRQNGCKIFAVGTTVVRALESASIVSGEVQPLSKKVGLYIKPGHEFRLVDHLITNFHLPKSSLVILASAFAGREKVLDAYQVAIKHNYRFYSYGDCMLIL
ncbi:MAG: tRNA preQ1(34) S-adenosylmethionine ribosyltransferase-isomerase QueA [Candidatus Zixiibacteriota bacterium]|nr:MAG: tRNA preQ1(34) S-adenosylmethionine ribosyltransferase-isomerase QueA [candidate division Zixibacteria bacterium]